MISLLRRLGSVTSFAPVPDPQIITIGSRDIVLRFKRNAMAKRMVLRLSLKGDHLVMTLPRKTGLAEALRFVKSSSAWIEKSFAKLPDLKAVGSGNGLLYKGVMHQLHFSGGRRGVVSVADHLITVPGDEAHAERRLRDWLKGQAKQELTHASRHYAQAMQTKFTTITIRDQKSRWGSCAASGALSYSWRLILAPPEVLDYVAAHEVAHLREMNHGPRFWRLVLTHCANSKSAKQWLKAHGRELHRYL